MDINRVSAVRAECNEAIRHMRLSRNSGEPVQTDLVCDTLVIATTHLEMMCEELLNAEKLASEYRSKISDLEDGDEAIFERCALNAQNLEISEEKLHSIERCVRSFDGGIAGVVAIELIDEIRRQREVNAEMLSESNGLRCENQKLRRQILGLRAEIQRLKTRLALTAMNTVDGFSEDE